MAKHLDIESTLNTDEAKRYVGIGRTFKDHQTVDHIYKHDYSSYSASKSLLT
jgi:hypothetical protein